MAPSATYVNGLRQPYFRSAAARLRAKLRSDELVVCPGVYDGISARVALEVGFDALYMTGAGTTASRLGMPDLALATLDDFVGNAAMIAGIDPVVPVVADADVGFGGAPQIHRAVRAYARAGVAGLHIEDQVANKRCGHLLGKEVVDHDEWRKRIKAACMARDSDPAASPDDRIVIIARTDAAQPLGIEEALKRLKIAVEVGADVVFLEGVTRREDIEMCVKRMDGTPVLLNLIYGGTTPAFTVDEARGMGIRLAIFPGITMVPAVHAFRESLRSLQATGTDRGAARGMAPKDFFQVVGLDQAMEIDAQCGGTSYSTL